MITADMVKELRERTGAGMMDCKKALSSTDGDMEKAIEVLREKGLAAAAKKSGRIASEGLVATYISEDGSKGAMVEVNCETDFVGKNEDFISFVNNIAKQAANTNSNDVNELLEEKYIAGDLTVKETLTNLIAKIGENMNFRRFVKFTKSQNGIIKNYLHGGGRIGVIVQLSCENENNDVLDELSKDIAMQIAAANPSYINKEEVSSDVLDKEKEIYKVQAMNEGKSENIAEKMVQGRIQKFYKEVCLIEQLWIRNADYTIKKLIDEKSKQLSSPITIVKFARFEKGEGLEKKCEDFAAEVQAQMNK